jgi:hypothetical protein
LYFVSQISKNNRFDPSINGPENLKKVGDRYPYWDNTLQQDAGGGLARFDGQDWKVYDKSNSNLPDNEVNKIIVDKNDYIWMGTYAGLTLFKPY